MDDQEYRFLVLLHATPWTGDRDGAHRSSHWVSLHKISLQYRFPRESGGFTGMFKSSNSCYRHRSLASFGTTNPKDAWSWPKRRGMWSQSSMANGCRIVPMCFLRTYLRINACLSEDFVSSVFSGYFRGLEERRSLSQIQEGTTANRRWN
jgi:hypothetical protein